jgi:hypothetical protein
MRMRVKCGGFLGQTIKLRKRHRQPDRSKLKRKRFGPRSSTIERSASMLSMFTAKTRMEKDQTATLKNRQRRTLPTQQRTEAARIADKTSPTQPSVNILSDLSVTTTPAGDTVTPLYFGWTEHHDESHDNMIECLDGYFEALCGLCDQIV